MINGAGFQEDKTQEDIVLVQEDKLQKYVIQEDRLQKDISIQKLDETQDIAIMEDMKATPSTSAKVCTTRRGIKNRLKFFRTQCSKFARHCRVTNRK